MISSKILRLCATVTLVMTLLPAGAYAQDAAPSEGGASVQPAEQQEITLSEDTLSQYVGTYQLAPNAAMSITLENGALHTQLTGQPKFALVPESETRFALKAVPAAIEFERDAAGAVTAAVLQQNGRSLRAPRV